MTMRLLLRFPPVAGGRGRPKNSDKKTATGLPRRNGRKCVEYDKKSKDERSSVRVAAPGDADVTSNYPADSEPRKLQLEQLPGAVLNESVDVQLLQPLLTSRSWQQLQQTIAEAKEANV